MTDEFEYKGKWWLPSNPQRIVDGTLTFSPADGAVLDLGDSLIDVPDVMNLLNDQNLGRQDLILGIAADGKMITLWDCYGTKLHISSPGLLSSQFLPQMVFLGAHFSKTEDMRFKSLSVRYSHLDEWVELAPPETQWSSDRREFSLKLRDANPVDAGVCGDCRICVHARLAHVRLSRTEARIEQHAYIEIEAATAKPINEYWHVLDGLRNLLGLLTGERVIPLGITGIASADGATTSESDTPARPVKVVYCVPGFARVCRHVAAPEMLLALRQLREQLPTCVTTWFRSMEELRPVHDLYFGRHHDPRFHVEHAFSSFVEALETYHRRMISKVLFGHDEMKAIRAAMLAALPCDFEYRDHISEKLNYANEHTLRNRLTEITNRFSDLSDKWIADQRGFVDKVVTTRNYLVHFDPPLEPRAARGDELLALTLKLKWLVVACLVEQLGLSPQETAGLLSANMKCQSEMGFGRPSAARES